MKILNVSGIIFYDNRYWCKYSVKVPTGKNEIRSVSFRDKAMAEQYHNSICRKASHPHLNATVPSCLK